MRHKSAPTIAPANTSGTNIAMSFMSILLNIGG